MNAMQCMAKFIAFQNEYFKKMYDETSDVRTAARITNLLRERAEIIKFANDVLNNHALLPTTKHTYLHVCNDAITQCDETLKELGQEPAKDKIISELAQMFPVYR